MSKAMRNIIFILIVIIYSLSVNIVHAETGGFKIKREVHGVTNHVDNVFTYNVENATESERQASNLPSNIKVRVDSDPDSVNYATGYGLIPGSMWEGITYPENGLYVFKVPEVASADSTTYPLAKQVYYVQIYVKDNPDTGRKEITYVGSKLNNQGSKIKPTNGQSVDPHSGEVQYRNDTEYDNLYTSEAAFTNITIKNDIEGTEANKNKYFKYRVVIEGEPGDQYIIKGQDPQVTFKGKTITTKSIYTVGEENYIYLKAGQSVTIGRANDDLDQIKIGTKYRVTLVERDDYKPYIDGDESDSTDKTAGSNPKTNTIHFVNRKGMVLPDFVTKIVPLALLIILIIVSAYVIIKNRNIEEE
ncbi:MAG: hypothetical protein IJI43_01770 [Bacilli bacterium]|nr:hypothetical protein [Bacilli bacterium]